MAEPSNSGSDDVSTPDDQPDRTPNTDLLDLRIARALDKRGSGSSGGGPYDPGMEARVAKLEAGVAHIQSDLSDIKADFRGFRSDMNNSGERLRAEMAQPRQNDSTDFRLIFGAIIAVAIGLAALMARGFRWF